MIGAVITYYDNGTRGAGGQTVGADGSGAYTVVFEAETVEAAHEAARAYVRERLSPPQYVRVVVVVAEEGFCGNFLKVVKV